MTKKEFMEALKAQTGALPQAERDRLEEYYNEIIDDCIEDGIPEEEVIGALGSVDDLVRELSPSPAARQFTEGAEQLNSLDEIRIRVLDADVTVAREALDNGAAAQFSVSDPDSFRWLTRGGVLEIIETRNPPRGIRRTEQHRVTVTIGSAAPDRLIIESRGGDMELRDVPATELINLNSGSGDMRLWACECQGSLALVTRSGDVEINDSRAGGDMRVNAASGDIDVRETDVTGELRAESASGDIELRGIRSGRLSCRTASGDIEIERAEAGAVDLHSASGDVQLDRITDAGALTVETASGDIDLTRCDSPNAQLTTVSGDIEARMPNLPGGLTLNADTRAGRIRLPKRWAPPEGEGFQRRLSARTALSSRRSYAAASASRTSSSA